MVGRSGRLLLTRIISSAKVALRKLRRRGVLAPQRVLAFDLIVAWRILACVKLGRILPQLPASALYTTDELEVLLAATEKKVPIRPSRHNDFERSQPAGGPMRRLLGKKRRRRTGSREYWPGSAPVDGPDVGVATAPSSKGSRPMKKMRARSRLPR
jgi:hypothetical protein